MNSVLLWIGGLLVAILGLLFAAPYVIDWNAYRGVFEEEASRVLGRDVRVGGKVNLRLLPAPYVRFEKVRISDTEALLGEPFFRAEAFTLWLSTAPLLRGVVEASRIELDRPVLRLAINAEGKGNWQSLHVVEGSLPVMPSHVVFQNLKIREGAVSLRAAGGAQPVSLSRIDGELSATALDGPYRFRGSINWLGRPREVRLATSAVGADGVVRFKASLREEESGGLYAFDGALSELTPKGQITGSLTARMPTALVVGVPAEATGGATGGAAGKPGSGSMELKAQIEGNSESIRFNDLAIAFDQDGRPQLLNGEATASWRNDFRLQARLASRWLDLDRIAAGVAGGTPLVAARKLIEQIGSFLPPEGTTFATVDIDQVNLGRDALSGVRLALARAGGLTSIGELKAGLPGNARLDLRGTLGAGLARDGFNGELVLHGTSLKRFWTWAVGKPGDKPGNQPQSGAAVPFRSEGPFALSTRIKLLPDSLALEGANLEFGRAQLRTNLNWRWAGKRRLDIEIDGNSIDVAALFPGALALSPPAAEAAGGAKAAAGAKPTTPLVMLAEKAKSIEAAVGDLGLKVTAGSVGDGASVLRDVEADVALNAGTLDVKTLRLVSAEGVRIDMQGRLGKVTSKPAGRLTGWLTAEQPKALRAVAGMFSSASSPIDLDKLTQAGRANVGFNATIGGESKPERVEVRAHGGLGDGQVSFSMALDGGLDGWRSRPIDLNMRIDSPDMVGMVRRIANARPAEETRKGSQRAGTLLLKATGPDAAGLLADVRLDADRMALAYKGRLGVASTGPLELEGKLTTRIGAFKDLFALTADGRLPAIEGTRLEGTMDVVRKDGVIRLASRDVRLGSSRLAGELSAKAAGERLRLDGRIRATQASFPALLDLVLDGSAREAGGETDRPAWPEARFSMAAVNGLEGRIALSTPVLTIAPGLKVDSADMQLEFGNSRLALSELKGAVLGGRLAGGVSITQTSVGADVAITGRLADARLERLTSSRGANRSLGTASLDIELTGRGLSPAGAVAVISGKGLITVRSGRVRGLAPDAVNSSALKLIESNDDISREAIETAIRNEMAKGEVAIGNVRLPVTVSGGILKVAPLEIGLPEANLRNITTVDLGVLKVDSEWRIKPLQPLVVGQAKQRREPLPEIELVWAGPLQSIARVEVRTSVDALERELATRKLERDAERLELLRREDEERARLETERIRRLDEAARGPGAGAPPGPPPVIQAPFPLPATPRSSPQLPPLPQRAVPRRQSATTGQGQATVPSDGTTVIRQLPIMPPADFDGPRSAPRR